MTITKDVESDNLISIYVDARKSDSDRRVAAQKLYEMHSPAVMKRIAKQVFNPEDVLDIAQTVWMTVLRRDTLIEKYTKPQGKFAAFLEAPIKWAILKHLEKLPYTIDSSGRKHTPDFTELTDSSYQQNLDTAYYEYAVENIIKPNLKTIESGNRCVYISSEYDLVFHDQTPSFDEAAHINGYEITTATKLHESASNKPAESRTDDETSLYVTLHYRSLLAQADTKVSRGKHLSMMVGLSEAVFRTRLHYAKKYLLGLVRNNNLVSIAEPDHV